MNETADMKSMEATMCPDCGRGPADKNVIHVNRLSPEITMILMACDQCYATYPIWQVP